MLYACIGLILLAAVQFFVIADLRERLHVQDELFQRVCNVLPRYRKSYEESCRTGNGLLGQLADDGVYDDIDDMFFELMYADDMSGGALTKRAEEPSL